MVMVGVGLGEGWGFQREKLVEAPQQERDHKSQGV